MAQRPTLVLASQSPRRLALLAQLHLIPDKVAAADLDETAGPDEAPRLLAQRLACAKAVAQPHPAAFVLAADTVVAVGRRVLPQPTTEPVARRCLALLSGRKHHVYTAVALRHPDGSVAERLSESHVTFSRLTEDQIAGLLASGEWRGKAGGYAIQGIAASLVRAFSGSHTGVVGLPLFETAQLLRGQGFRIP